MKQFSVFLVSVLLIAPISAGAVSVYTDSGVEVEVESVNETSVQSETRAEAESGNGDASANAQVQLEVGTQSTGTDEYMEITVTGDPDFDLFVEQVETNNTDVADVRAQESGAIEVEYKHTGRFLGVIPVTVMSKTVVDADEDGNARIRVEMPWWSFFVTGVGKVRSQVESRLASSADVSAGVSANASVSSRTHVIEIIVSSLKATADVEADANVN